MLSLPSRCLWTGPIWVNIASVENGLRNRRIGLAAAALLLVMLAVRHPSADINILTHDRADTAPHRIQAAVDLGLIGVSILYTWTTERTAR